MAEEADEITTKYCSTCKQDVPAANFEMHSIHCQRFLTLCPHCKESVNKNYLDEHIEEDHSQIKCDACGESMEKIELESHKETSCKSRTLTCEYCEISLPASDMDEHRESCGSRTEECETCKRRILVKNLEHHIDSGCQIPDTRTTTNNKTAVETKFRKPENLFYDNSPSQSIIRFNRVGKGFSIHQHFLDSEYTDKNERKHSNFRNGHLNEVNPDGASVEPTSISPVMKNLTSMKSFHEEDHRKEKPKRYDNVPRKPKVHYSTDFNSKKPFNTREVLPEFGIPDSDSDDDGTNEKKPFRDLADDTFLPCEFCKAKLPADSLAFHQANCDEMPPTPPVRQQQPAFPQPVFSYEGFPQPAFPQPSNPGFSDQGFSDLGFSDPGFSDSGFSDHPTSDLQSIVRENTLHTSEPQQASATTISSNKQDMGQCLAPCEFCEKLCSLDDLAVHQITCAKNPNLEHFESPERHPTHSPPPNRKTPPKTTTNPSASLSAPPAKPIQSKDSNPSLPSRQTRRPLAPTFSAQPPQLKTSIGARPNTKLHPVDDGDVKRVTQKPKRSGKFANGSPPAKHSPSIDKTFREVNVLGGDQPRTFATPSRNSNGRKPYETPFGVSNGDLFGNGLSLEGLSSSGNGSRAAGRGIGRGNVFAASDHFTSTTQSRNPQGGRGNPGARKYVARGGQAAGRQSRGGGTATIQTSNPRNPNYNADQHGERNDGLTYNELGLDPPLERTNPVDDGDVKRDTQKSKRSGKFANGSPPAKHSPSIDKTFREVNVLGGDQPRTFATPSRNSNGRKPYETPFGVSNGDPFGNGLSLEGRSSFGNGSRAAGRGIGRGNMFTDWDHFKSTTQSRNPRGGRGNPGARKYVARGGQAAGRQSRGGGTATIQTSNPRNPNYNADQHGERNDDLTYNELGLDPPLERTNQRPPCPEVRNRGRGGGHRLGPGKSGSRGGRDRNQRSQRGKK